MARKEFTLQGFTKRTHGEALKELFEVPDITSALVSVAFVKASGVEHIHDLLDKHGKMLTVFAGIRNEITTHQGLAKLLGIKGSTLYAVDTGSRRVVFHPKLYLVRGKAEARVLVGSANMTLGGLNNNIEAGVSVVFDLKDKDDLKTIDDIEKEFAAIPKDFKEHVLPITKIAELDELLKQNRLIDEALVRPPPPPASGGSKASPDAVPRIKLLPKPIFPMAVKQQAPKKKGGPPKPTLIAPAPTTAGTAYEEVWRSKPLSARSLTIKSGANTNPTGSTTLGKGMMDIDQVTYFRNDVFGHLKWETYKNRAGNDAEKVDATFDLFIKGKNVGQFTLTLRHSLTRAAAAADDKNSPTELSWNDARPYVMRDDLLDRTMTLLTDTADSEHFAVEID